MLRITRHYRDNQNRSYQEEEFVRHNDAVIQAYTKIRQKNSDKYM